MNKSKLIRVLIPIIISLFSIISLISCFSPTNNPSIEYTSNPPDIRVLSPNEKEGVKTISMPEDNIIIVFEIGKERVPIYTQSILKELETLNNKIYFIKISKDLSNLYLARKELVEKNPSIVFLPHEDDNTQNVEIVRISILDVCEELVRHNNKCMKIAFYCTPGMIRQYNLIYPMTEQEMDIKRKAMNEYPSQMDRLPYDSATEYAMKANIRKARIAISPHINGEYAEFYQAILISNGRIQEMPKGNFCIFGGKNIGKNIKECSKFTNIKNDLVVILSPHYDDAEIAAGGLAGKLSKDNKLVIVDFTEGHRAVIPGITDIAQKVKIRENEAENASRIIGADKNIFLRLGFYDNIDSQTGQRIITDAEKQRVYMLLLDMYLKFKKQNSYGKIVIFMPQKEDAHPDHVATYKIGFEAAKKLSAAENTEVIVFFYIAPWAGKANLYNYISTDNMKSLIDNYPIHDNDYLEAMLYSGQAAAIIGAEITAADGFGSRALNPSEIGGSHAGRLNIQEICPVQPE